MPGTLACECVRFSAAAAEWRQCCPALAEISGLAGHSRQGSGPGKITTVSGAAHRRAHVNLRSGHATHPPRDQRCMTRAPRRRALFCPILSRFVEAIAGVLRSCAHRGLAASCSTSGRFLLALAELAVAPAAAGSHRACRYSRGSVLADARAQRPAEPRRGTCTLAQRRSPSGGCPSTRLTWAAKHVRL